MKMFPQFSTLPQWFKGTLILLLLLSSAFFIGRCTAPQSTQDKGGVSTQVRVETKRDTIYIDRIVIKEVVVSKPKLVKVYVDKNIPVLQPDRTPTLAHRVYQDTIQASKTLKVGYTAKITGVLDSLTIGLRDTTPQMIIKDSVKTTVTITRIKRPTGLYLGLQSSINRELTNFGPTVDLVRPKFSLGVGYDIRQQAPLLRIGINLLKDKRE